MIFKMKWTPLYERNRSQCNILLMYLYFGDTFLGSICSDLVHSLSKFQQNSWSRSVEILRPVQRTSQVLKFRVSFLVVLKQM